MPRVDLGRGSLTAGWRERLKDIPRRLAPVCAIYILAIVRPPDPLVASPSLRLHGMTCGPFVDDIHSKYIEEWMRRRRMGWLLTAILPCLVMAQSGYDAQPIGRPAAAPTGPLPPPRPVPRGYQPPPSPLLFEAPRSRYNSANPLADMSQYRPYPNNPSFLTQWTAPPAAPVARSSRTSARIQNPPDVLNNIIVHIYLNAKEKQSHTTATSGPIKGLFGIGTSHGGPGSHTNPIVITKDFDRDTLEFIEEDRARQLVDEGPANIVEVKAMVSTPDRKIESTLNKAVNSELDRAIPMVMNRMQGPMPNMDNELRKELEQALVDEIAKNLGETIDEMGTTPSEDDLGKLIVSASSITGDHYRKNAFAENL
ncbi:hypothetical protein ANCCEY_07791 [Ancylostoma ceylanicum]|uniref:Uncharacterized protein n=1 Tax=Ancylostoma ceylanicum TaxID=53326 RepID=A0A0D6LMK0_9BILA|nr:hypothetical protein ANCCEY_07791 [Ancylostoma ceylanicum]